MAEVSPSRMVRGNSGTGVRHHESRSLRSEGNVVGLSWENSGKGIVYLAKVVILNKRWRGVKEEHKHDRHRLRVQSSATAIST